MMTYCLTSIFLVICGLILYYKMPKSVILPDKNVFTTSVTSPVDTSIPWLDPSSGTWSAWYVDAWVACSGPAGVDSTSSTVTRSTAPTGSTITMLPYEDETVFLQSSTPLSIINDIVLLLPAAADSRVGQVKTFISSKNITTLIVSASGGGLIWGTPLTTALPYDPYAYQCIALGSWLRLA